MAQIIKLAGRYRLENQIAEGGMATVWLAADETLARPVAAKILHEHLSADPVFRKRFRIEALSAARLSHPNIVSVFDTGVHDGRPFIVMEYLAGGTMKDILQNGPLDPRRACAIGAEVCKALSFAHGSGIVHRDIKPANILFSESGLVKVGDFGIAKAAFFPTDLTDTGAVLGTVRYLAPEQVQGLEPDGRADIYALAVVLYEAVTGTPPFTGDSDLAAATARVGRAPLPPRDLSPAVPRTLDAALMKAMAPEREARFADAASFEAALRAVAPDATDPAGGIRAPARKSKSRSWGAKEHSFVRSELRWLVPIVLIALLAVGLSVPALRQRLGGLIARPEPPPTEPIRIVGGSSFDPPPGDGEENDERVRFAFDGRPDTAWATVSYRSAELGGLKEGVGIYVDLGSPRRLNNVTVQSVAGGWEGAIRHSDDGRTWSAPAASARFSSDETLEVEGEHQYWMVWITKLVETPGQGSSRNPFSVAIREIRPAGL